MAATATELHSFYAFVDQRLRSQHCDRSLDDLFSEWRACNPTDAEFDANVLAVRASLRDIAQGETGRPLDEFAAEFRQRNGI